MWIPTSPDDLKFEKWALDIVQAHRDAKHSEDGSQLAIRVRFDKAVWAARVTEILNEKYHGFAEHFEHSLVIQVVH